MTKFKFWFLVSLSAWSVLASAQTTDTEIMRLVNLNDGYVRSVRRHLHQYPEVSGKETETVKYLKRQLANIGSFDVHDVPGSTGFYAILDTRRSGPTIGLRTDIDGLPILEQPLNAEGLPKPFVSKNEGVSQGCGHDSHMAILLGAAKVLWHLRSQLTGRFVFIFEEGEESNTGIRPMISALRGIHFDAIYGNHLSSLVPTGKLFVRQGPIMAGMATLALHVNGRGGHASRPDHAVNPVPAAAGIISALGQAWVNQRDPTQTVTLGLTQMDAGSVYNVIPNSVFLGGTMRFFSQQQGQQALDIVRRVSTNVAAAHQCTVSYDSVMTVNLPPVVNDTLLSRRVATIANRLYPSSVVDDDDYVWWASETFALYQTLAPTVFVHVGTRNKQKGSTAAHHTDHFDVDDDALQYGVGAMVGFAVNGLTSEEPTSTAISNFPTLQQTTGYTCGNVSALMVMKYYGITDETEEGLAVKMHTHVDSQTPGAQPGSAKLLTDYGTNVVELHKYFSKRSDMRIVASSYHGESPEAHENISPAFADYEQAARFFKEQLLHQRPVMVCWNAWGGHWTVVIGYDDSGTPDILDDDVLTMADPYDKIDKQCDGLFRVSLVQFYYDWFCNMTPVPWQLQPYLVVEKI